MGVGAARWRKLSTVIYARALPTMLTGEAAGEAAAVPAAVPAVLETATETTPAPPARRCSGLPHGVKAVKKSGKYQGQVYDSLDTKKQRGVGTFATAELAAAAVEAAEAQLKQGISPWAAPTRVNKFKRGERPMPQPKKRVASVVVSDCKLPKTVPLPASRADINNPCFADFLVERSGEDL